MEISPSSHRIVVKTEMISPWKAAQCLEHNRYSINISHYWSVPQLISFRINLSFPAGSAIKNLLAMQDTRQEPWVLPLVQEGLLDKEMATHSSIFAWDIPWTDESSWLQSMESHKRWTWLSNGEQEKTTCRKSLVWMTGLDKTVKWEWRRDRHKWQQDERSTALGKCLKWWW